MKISTWNINGVRARAEQIVEWVAVEQPDILALQELKASPDQVPDQVRELDGYQSCWHGAAGGYSGVSLHWRTGALPAIRIVHPEFDMETRIVVGETDDLAIASVYVPNGGKDFDAKLQFMESLIAWAEGVVRSGKALVVCGDLNVALSDMDVHPSQRKPDVIGQRPDERALMQRLLAAGLTDVARHLHPDDDRFFTWWPYWKAARQRNLGWRIDYILAVGSIIGPDASCEVRREFGSSDHAPLLATL